MTTMTYSDVFILWLGLLLGFILGWISRVLLSKLEQLHGGDGR